MSRPPRILVVDDSATVRMDLSEILGAAAFDVVARGTVREARAALADGSIDLALLDIILPDGDGVELLREMRADPRTAKIPVMLLSTKDDVADRVTGLVTGAHAYLGKPYDPVDVVARVRLLTAAPLPVEESTAEPPKLLIVDDSATYRLTAEESLANEGYGILSAASGEEALERLATDEIDCVLLDLVMPGLGGVETCRRIKGTPAWRAIPVVMVTAHEDSETLGRCLGVGADDYVTKAAGFEVLVVRLRAHLARSRLEREERRLREQILRMDAERKLRLTEERARLIIETASDAFIAMDDKGLITEWNPAAEKTFGRSRDEILGRAVAETIMPERYRESHRNGLARFLETGEGPVLGKRLELSAIHRDGREFPIEITIVPLEQSGVWSFHAFLHDISERKRLQAELERSNKDLEQFAYAASHDLQEPLRMVSNFVQLLARRYSGRLDSDADEFIAFAIDGAGRMKAMIDDLLDFSRVGRRTGPIAPIDTNAALGQALANLRTAIDESGAAVTTDALPVVVADAAQVTRLFQNIIGNAIKFRGERPPVIRIDARREGGFQVFSIRDNGIGIESENLDRIFGLFQRLHSREDYPGTGIGLSLCRRIVERQGGRIWVESKPGEGSTFFFTLPAESVEGAAS